jgi:predicted enzyme related to lactoylglutathione lyase
MKASQVLATVGVSDFDASSAWYARLFGRAPDHCPSTSCAEWEIADSATIQVVQKDTFVDDRHRSGGASLGIIVEHLDDILAQLRKRQIDVAPPQMVTHFVRLAPVTDPDGNRVTFVESIAG